MVWMAINVGIHLLAGELLVNPYGEKLIGMKWETSFTEVLMDLYFCNSMRYVFCHEMKYYLTRNR